VRLVRSAAVVAAVLAGTGAARAGGLPSKIDVRADGIDFFPYANAALLAATGHVVLREGSRMLEADAVRVDLYRNRLLASGHVRVLGGPRPLDATAYALDLATGRATLLRASPVPATFAVRDDDPASAVEEPAPADTFEAADLDGQRPYMRSRHALVTPNAGVRMSPAEFPTGAGPSLTLPTFLYTLVQNQHINYSAAPAASFDQPYSLFGSPASLTAAHLRYDGTNGVTLGLDTHLVEGNRAYFVASLLPFWDRQIDWLSFQQLRPGVQQQLSGFATFGAFANQSIQYQLQHSGTFLKETFSAGQFDSSNSGQLVASTYEHDVGHYFGYQLHAGYGYDHNAGGYPFNNDFRKDLGAELLAPDFRLLGTPIGTRYDYDNTLYSYPHQILTGTLTVSAGRAVTRALRVFAQVQFQQSDDRYRDPAVAAYALGLPDPALPYYAPDGTPWPGYFSYAGESTYRTYELDATFQGRKPDDRIEITLYHTRDFPQFHGFGRAPYALSLDVTRRIAPELRVELGRSYDFGWGGRYLSPQYSFSVGP